MRGRKLSRRDILKGAADARRAAAAVFASPVRAEAPEPVAITPALVEAAKKEGKLIFYSSMDLPVGEKLGKAFEAAFPGVTIQIERSGSERLFQRIDQEFASSIRAADIINSSDASHFISWKKNGWLMPFVPEDVARHFLPELPRSRRHVRDLAHLSVIDRLQHQPGQSPKTRRRALPTCSIPNGRARWSRATRPIAAPS